MIARRSGRYLRVISSKSAANRETIVDMKPRQGLAGVLNSASRKKMKGVKKMGKDFLADYPINLPGFTPDGQATSIPGNESEDLGRLLSTRMGLKEAGGDCPGESFEARIGDYDFSGLLLRARPAVSASLNTVNWKTGGAFAFIKASGIGLVPAAIALEASARFRERFANGGSETGLKGFVVSLGDALEDLARGHFLMGSFGAISSSGDILLLPVGNPFVVIRRQGRSKSQRLKFADCPALGMFSAPFPGMASPYKVYKLSLAPGDSVFFMHGEFEEASILPAIDEGTKESKSPLNSLDVLKSVIRALKEDDDRRGPSTWPDKPRNDSFVVRLTNQL